MLLLDDLLKCLDQTQKLKKALIYQQETLKKLLKIEKCCQAQMKQCPMCETYFENVSTEDFENHVINHFEIKDLSLL